MQDVIYVACDDSGAEAKGWILEYLDAHGYAWRDCGGDETPSRYPYYAAKVAAAVSRGEIRRGILICGSGIGMSIAANKFRGVRASVVTDDYSARLTLRIVETWLTTDYDGGHHQGSLDLLAEMEAAMLPGAVWCPEEIPYEPFEWDPKQSL